jgi:hypothetical protein
MINIKKTLIALVITLCLLPAALLPVLGVSPQPANETPAAAPEWTTEEGTINWNYLTEFSDFISKRFVFRSALITAYSALSSTIFSVSQSDDVLIGADGWLFFEETTDDFLYKNVLSDEEIQEASQMLLQIQTSCEAQGIAFLFVIAPNKNSIYPEYMPYLGERHGTENNSEKLIKQLQADGVAHVDLFRLFRDFKQQEKRPPLQSDSLYHQWDTHWTSFGAAIACDAILTELNRAAESFASGDITQPAAREFEADLYKMLYPIGRQKDTDVTLRREFSYTYDKPVNSPESITIQTTCAGKEGSVLVYRDSFGNALYPFLAESFGNALFSRKAPYTFERAMEQQVDTLIIEIAERNLADFDQYIQ